MRQYDKIMVPADEKETSPHFIAGGMWEAKSDAIVVTIKDLQDLWDKAWAGGILACQNRTFIINNIIPPMEPPDFTQYLKEQGINTIP